MCPSHRRLYCDDVKFPDQCLQWPRKRCPPPDPRMCDDLQRRGLKRSADECRWHYWSHRNDLAVQQMAMVTKVCPEKIASFLFDLTLQNYKRLFHPRRCGFNACHVPYCHPSLCNRYMEIFDDGGNLKDPAHPRTLFTLLQLYQQVLAVVEKSGCDPLPFGSTRKADKRTSVIPYQMSRLTTGTRCYRIRVPEPITQINISSRQALRTFEPDMRLMTGTGYYRIGVPEPVTKRSISSLQDPSNLQSGKTAVNARKAVKIAEKEEKSESNEKPQEHVKLFLKYKVPSGKEGWIRDRMTLDSKYAEIDDMFYGLMDEKGRRRGMGSGMGQLGELRSEQAQYLINLIRDINEKQQVQKDYRIVVTALSDIDLQDDKRVKQVTEARRHKDAVFELSKFYTHTVSKEVEKSDGERPRKYYAEAIPVMYHEPFQSDKAWTWMRRHPSQKRLLSDGKIGVKPIKRYRRESVESAVRREGVRWSIHSAFSVTRSIKWNPTSRKSKPKSLPKKPKK